MNRSENTTNRKLCFFWFETVSKKIFQLQKKNFFATKNFEKNIFSKNEKFQKFHWKFRHFGNFSENFQKFSHFQKIFFYIEQKKYFFLKLNFFFGYSFDSEKVYLSIGVVCRAIPALLSRFWNVSKNLDFAEND